LAALGDPRAIAPLCRVALYAPAAPAAAAASALGRLPVTRASLITLEEALTSAYRCVRIESALGLAQMAAGSEGQDGHRARAALSEMSADDVGPACKAAVQRLDAASRDLLFAAAFGVAPRRAVQTVDAMLGTRSNSGSALDLLNSRSTLELLQSKMNGELAPVLAPFAARAAQDLLQREGEQASEAVGATIHAILEALYTQCDPLVRAPLIAALQTLGDRAVQTLAERLTDEHPEDVPTLVDILEQLGWTPTPNRAGARFWIARRQYDECVAAGDEAIGPLIEAFLGTDLEQSDAAAQVLARLGWAPGDDELAIPFALSLGDYHDLSLVGKDALPKLASVLSLERQAAHARGDATYREDRRAALVSELPRIAGRDAADVLKESLRDDPAGVVRRAALESLEAIEMREGGLLLDSLEVERTLVEEAASDGRQPSVRMRADLATMLGEIGWLDAIEALASMVQIDPEEECRQCASEALLSMWDNAPERILSALLGDSEQTPDLGDVLQSVHEHAANLLASWLCSGDRDKVSRATAGLMALANQGGDIQAALRVPLFTGPAQVRRSIAQIYERLGSRPTQPDELAAFWLALGDLDRAVAVGRAAIPVLLEALPDFDWRTRGNMAIALLRLQLDPRSPILDDVVESLLAVSETLDEEVKQMASGVGADSSDEGTVSLTVSHHEERHEARKLLAAIISLRAKQLNRYRT